MLITFEAYVELVKFPSWGLSTWKAFVNQCLFKQKRGILLELGLLAAGRLGYPGKDRAYCVYDDEVVRLLVWRAEHWLAINMNKRVEDVPKFKSTPSFHEFTLW